MRKEKIIKLNIGDLLYNYQNTKSGLFKYKIIEIRESLDNIQYVIECQDCKDHPKCKILITQIDNLKQFRYVSMIDEDSENEQYYWHQDIYFLNINDCKKYVYKKYISDYEKEIKDLEVLLNNKNKSLNDIKNLLELLT